MMNKNFFLSTLIFLLFCCLDACKEKTKVIQGNKDIILDDIVWTSKNLSVVTYCNGDPIPQVKSDSIWSHLETGAWCYYNNDSSNNARYGKLYNWYAVNDPRGLAPAGYHIPTDQEWGTLCAFLGGDRVAGKKMKSKTSWGSNGNGINSIGFNGFAGGYRFLDGLFFQQGETAFWWSATEAYPSSSWYRALDAKFDFLISFDGDKRNGFYVRLIKDRL
jgi:uncharacterized protein (TIGR02145 family)